MIKSLLNWVFQDKKMIEEWNEKFPNKCIVCSYHSYGYANGITSDPLPPIVIVATNIWSLRVKTKKNWIPPRCLGWPPNQMLGSWREKSMPSKNSTESPNKNPPGKNNSGIRPTTAGRYSYRVAGIETNPPMNMKKYCRKCGMILTRSQKVFEYDSDTGKPIIYLYWKCPNKRGWWNITHCQYRTDSDGNYRSSFYITLP